MKLKKMQKANPLNREEKKFYLVPEYAGEITIEDLAEALSDACTLNKTDIKAVLEALARRVPLYLRNGLIVRLGELGHLRLSISSNGQEVKENLTVKDVAKTRVIYIPGVGMKEAIKGTAFMHL